MREPERIPRVHPLDNPGVWFVLQTVEYVVLVFVLASLVPDGWPVAIKAAVSIAFLAALVGANYSLRRRFIPR